MVWRVWILWLLRLMLLVLVLRFAVLVDLVMDTQNEHSEKSICDFKRKEKCNEIKRINESAWIVINCNSTNLIGCIVSADNFEKDDWPRRKCKLLP